LLHIKYRVLRIQISEKVLQDLEFTTVLKQVSEYCISELGKEKVITTTPFSSKKNLLVELQRTNEYLFSFVNENKIPNHSFDNLLEQLKKLAIDNSYIEAEDLLKIATLTETVEEQKKFFTKFKTYYPALFDLSDQIDFAKEVQNEIKKIITPYGSIVNHASTSLRLIRKEIAELQSKISQSFTQALTRAKSAGYLDDIKETIVDNQRVLAVLAMHRKKVKGSLLGSSKSGNIVYISPQATLKHQRDLQNALYDEKQEIIRILRDLCEKIRPYIPILNSYITYLTHLDSIAAKAKYGYQTNAVLPTINKDKKIKLINAFHPILWVKNKSEEIKTIPQTIELNHKQQIIVISGPNAGGKSITLKTIGLLQVMLQSGLLIPVDEKSETYIFDTILTDIGDNQSIENQLSTYSYRLKNMRYFLRKCSENTLFLIDEFGTGSDPELGGALAEIFLEEFYDKKAFGIITTHYANLKVLASELENVTNANMQFNEKTLEPLYKLYIGQAGSSFTFEVAQKNGIPFRLINKAKKRVESQKIRLDKTISKLQKERNRLQKTSDSLEKKQSQEQQKIDSLQEKEEKVKEKLEGFLNLYDNNQRMLNLGRKTNELLNKYFQTNNKKELTTHFIKWALSERTKHLKKNPEKPKTKTQKKELKVKEDQQKQQLEKVEKEVLIQVKEVRVKKKKEETKIAKEKAKYVFKVNDRVRIIDSNSIGIIERIEKNKALLNYGLFTTETDITKIELVEKAK